MLPSRKHSHRGALPNRARAWTQSTSYPANADHGSVLRVEPDNPIRYTDLAVEPSENLSSSTDSTDERYISFAQMTPQCSDEGCSVPSYGFSRSSGPATVPTPEGSMADLRLSETGDQNALFSERLFNPSAHEGREENEQDSTSVMATDTNVAFQGCVLDGVGQGNRESTFGEAI